MFSPNYLVMLKEKYENDRYKVALWPGEMINPKIIKRQVKD
jgi:hypothetical protein